MVKFYTSQYEALFSFIFGESPLRCFESKFDVDLLRILAFLLHTRLLL